MKYFYHCDCSMVILIANNTFFDFELHSLRCWCFIACIFLGKLFCISWFFILVVSFGALAFFFVWRSGRVRFYQLISFWWLLLQLHTTLSIVSLKILDIWLLYLHNIWYLFGIKLMLCFRSIFFLLFLFWYLSSTRFDFNFHCQAKY